MSYAIKKLYGIEVGTYERLDKPEAIVVLDVINHLWHSDKQFQSAVADPLVVYRPLSEGIDHHARNVMLLSEFKLKFKKT